MRDILLTESQRAMVGARLLGQFTEAAKGRQQEHGGTAPGKAKTLRANLPEVKEDRRARDDAAAQVNVLPRSRNVSANRGKPNERDTRGNKEFLVQP